MRNVLLLVIPASIRRQPAHVARWRAERDALIPKIEEITALIPDAVEAHWALARRAGEVRSELRAALLKPATVKAAASLGVHIVGVELAERESLALLETLRRDLSRLLARQRVLKVLLR